MDKESMPSNAMEGAMSALQGFIDKALSTGRDISLGYVVIEDFDRAKESADADCAARTSEFFAAAAVSTIKQNDLLLQLDENVFIVALFGCRLNIANVRLAQIRDRFKKAIGETFGINFFVNHGVAELQELPQTEQRAAELAARAASRLKRFRKQDV